MTAGVGDEVRTISGQLTELRRAIHREPEIGLQLPRTQEKVLAALDGLPLEISLGRSVTSVTAVLRGEQPGRSGRTGKTVLLRGDMDALPIAEQTGLPYASAIDGAMHACGHDLHTAMLAGAAKLLAARRAELAGDVIFMFQPGEEGPGGARYMIEEGVLDAAGERPAAAYALHVASSELPLGVYSARAGTALAAADVLDVTVRGHGGHASKPHLAADPIPVACEIVVALQTLVTRKFDAFDPIIITVGSFHAGTKDNIIPDTAHFEASIRTLSRASRDRIKEAAVVLARQIAAAHGLSAEVNYVDGYPVTVNDDGEAAFAEGVVTDVFGPERFIRAPYPITGSEDFSYVLEQVPGAFIFLGACPPDRDPATAPDNHSAEAVFDDAVLTDGAALYAELAMRRLAAD
jgi:amidohydrolase